MSKQIKDLYISQPFTPIRRGSAPSPFCIRIGIVFQQLSDFFCVSVCGCRQQRMFTVTAARRKQGTGRKTPNGTGAWASHNPGAYVAGKLQWDHTADVDEILADFYEKYCGPVMFYAVAE